MANSIQFKMVLGPKNPRTDCSICTDTLEPNQPIFRHLDWGKGIHEYHPACLKQHLETQKTAQIAARKKWNPTCPLCNRSIANSDEIINQTTRIDSEQESKEDSQDLTGTFLNLLSKFLPVFPPKPPDSPTVYKLKQEEAEREDLYKKFPELRFKHALEQRNRQAIEDALPVAKEEQLERAYKSAIISHDLRLLQVLEKRQINPEVLGKAFEDLCLCYLPKSSDAKASEDMIAYLLEKSPIQLPDKAIEESFLKAIRLCDQSSFIWKKICQCQAGKLSSITWKQALCLVIEHGRPDLQIFKELHPYLPDAGIIVKSVKSILSVPIFHFSTYLTISNIQSLIRENYFSLDHLLTTLEKAIKEGNRSSAEFALDCSNGYLSLSRLFKLLLFSLGNFQLRIAWMVFKNQWDLLSKALFSS